MPYNHWRFMTRLLRFIGLWFAGFGILFLIAAVRELVAPSANPGVYIVSPWVDPAVIGAIVLALGVVMTRMPPFRPDLPPGFRPRDWWTGDP